MRRQSYPQDTLIQLRVSALALFDQGQYRDIPDQLVLLEHPASGQVACERGGSGGRGDRDLNQLASIDKRDNVHSRTPV